MKLFLRTCFASALLILTLYSNAAKLTFCNRLEAAGGTPIVVNDKDTVNVIPKSSPGFTDIGLANYLTLAVNHNHHLFVNGNETTIIIVEVTPYDTNNTAQTPFNETLSVAYNPTLNTATFTDKHTRKFSTAWYKFIFKITSIKVNGVSTSLPLYLSLEGKAEVERIFHFGQVVNTELVMNDITERNLDCDMDGIIDEVEISWNTFAGTIQADEYQLEWTFINDYDTGIISNTKGLNEIEFNFRNNSTRISTTNTYYKIPLVFDRGYLVYRVRAVGYDTVAPTIPMYSTWNLVDADSLNGTGITSDNYYYVADPHEANKNWQITTTFAEEGKKKEVVSYFDGSLRNRQTVTRINSDNNTIVGETIYDYQGRPAVTVLPVPVTQPACTTSYAASAIKYYPNFNLDTSGTSYSAINFDVDDTNSVCQVLAPPMDTSNGASKYYSPNNPDKDYQQAFVPDAKGYPFTQVEYTNDNTGRIRKQGGVGTEFQLNQGHESAYLYGQPNQIQLDRMFGSEVGDATHYKKNIVIDPNGQTSVSYLDQEGRVVATALAGDSTENMQALPSSRYYTGDTLTVDLFNTDANGISNANTINADNTGIEFHTELTVAYQSDYIFNYDMEIDTLLDTCFKEDICINCVYKLQIEILDECGVDMLKASGDTINGLVGHFALNGDTLDFVTTCHSPSTYDTTHTDTLNLDPGVYTVVKKLTLNLAWRDSVVAAYIDTAYNHCVLTLQDFIDVEMAGIDTSGCHIDCEECLESLGTRDDFVASGRGTALQYDFLVEQCEAPCKKNTLCENTYQQMLMDVTPGGQYAEWNIIGGAYSVYSFPLSVLNDNNSLPDNIGTSGFWNRTWWRNPNTIINGTSYQYYFEEDGSMAKIYLTKDVDSNWVPGVYDEDSIFHDAGGYYIQPQQCAQLKDFINLFKVGWAKGLVTYHPEYCYYHTCSAYDEKATATDVYTSEDFDALLRSCETYQQALDTGLINPGSGLPTNWFAFSSTDPYDPFVYHGYGSYGTTLKNKFNDYVFYTGGDYNMYEQAAIMARCGTLTGTVPDASCLLFGTDHIVGATAHNIEIRNTEWGYLRDFYLSEKYQLQNSRADSIAMYDCYEFNDCIGNTEVWSYMYPMSIASNGPGLPAFQNLAQPCSYGYDQYYASKKKRFPDKNDIPGYSGSPMTDAYQEYIQTGQCPVTLAVQNMLSSLCDSNFVLNDTVDLIYFPMFNPVYMALTDFQPVAPITDYNYLWMADTTGWVNEDTLRINLVSDHDTCYFHFDKTGSGITDWDTIVGFSGLIDTGYIAPYYYFTINAHLPPDSGTWHPYELVGISGVTTCWNINKCSFPLTCKPTELGNTVYTLMNMLAMQDSLALTGVPLDWNLYDSTIAPTLYYNMGLTTNTGLTWDYLSADSSFNIIDPGSAANRIRIKITGYQPDTFDLSAYIDSIESFNNFVSHDACYFSLDAYDSSGTFLATLNLSAMYTDGTDSSCLNIADCDQPMAANCEMDQFSVTGDLLSSFVKDMLLHKPFDTTYPSYASPYFTGDLLTQLVAPITPIDNSYEVDSVTVGNKFETWDISLDSSCTIELTHKILGSTLYFYRHLVLLSGIFPEGSPDEDGNYHNFYLIGTYKRPGPPIRDTIHGYSPCIAFKPCQTCVDTSLYPDIIYNDTTEAIDGDGHHLIFVPGMGDDPGPAGSEVEHYRADVYSYVEYRDLIITNNKAHTHRADQLPLMSLYDYRSTKMRGKFSAYKNYLNGFAIGGGSMRRSDRNAPALGFAQWAVLHPELDNGGSGMTLRSLTPVDSSEFANDCDSLYNLYIDVVTVYNDSASANGWYMIDPSNIYDSTEFFENQFCYCVESYIAMLNGSIDGLVNANTSAFNLTVNNPGTYCTNLLKPPCTPNSAPVDTIANIPFTYVNPCVQYQLEIAVVNATNAYNQYVDSLTTYISNKYTQHCLGALETFTDTYNDKEYHFTLYYYDQAGNLIKTVPPAGVQLLDITAPTDSLEEILINDRTYGTQNVYTQHTLPTRYEYNSLNQLVKQTMPDHDNMSLWETKLTDGLDSNLTVRSVQFIDGAQGYLTGIIPGGHNGTRGVLYKTNDAGETWQKQSLAATNFRKIQMIDTAYGYAVGTNGVAYMTLDGGTTWDAMSNYHTNTKSATTKYVFDDVVDVSFKDRYHGVMATSREGYVRVDTALASDTVSNSGFSRINLSGLSAGDYTTAVTYNSTFHVYFLSATATDATTGLEYTANYVLSDPSGGAATAIKSYSNHSIKNICFIDTSSVNGFGCGTDGSLLYTGDRGKHWFYRPVSIVGKFLDVYFRDADNGVAIIEDAGGNGYVCATHDNGFTWTTLSDSAKDYNAFSPYDVSSTGAKLVAVGENGAVSRVLAIDGTPYGIIDIDGPNTTVDLKTGWGTVIDGAVWIYAGGNTNILYRTKDDGDTWTSQTITSISQFKKIAAQNFANDLTSPCINGTILASDNLLYKFYKATSVDTITYSAITINTPPAGIPTTTGFNDALVQNGKLYALNNSTQAHLYYSAVTNSAAVTSVTYVTSSQNVNTGLNPATACNSIFLSNSDQIMLIGGENGRFESGAFISGPGTISLLTGSNEPSGNIKPLPVRAMASRIATLSCGNNGQMAGYGLSSGSYFAKVSSSGTKVNLNDILFNGNTTGYTVGDGGNAFSFTFSSFVATLTAVTTPSSVDFNSITVNGTKAYIAGDNGTVLYTSSISTPGSFSICSAVTHDDLHAIRFVSTKNFAIAGGDNGHMRWCMGTNAMINKNFYQFNLNRVSFYNSSNGYVVGDRYTIKHTSDGGASWVTVKPTFTTGPATHTTQDLHGVKSMMLNNAVVVGKRETISHVSYDTSSASLLTASGKIFNDIDFGLPNIGYAVGEDGSDGWFQAVDFDTVSKALTLNSTITISTGLSGEKLNCVQGFKNSSVKFAAFFDSNNKMIWYGTSSNNPTVSSFFGGESIKDVFFLDNYVGYVVGDNGRLLKNTDFIANQTAWTAISVDDSLNNQLVDTDMEIYAIGFPSRYKGFMGGHYTGTPGGGNNENENYARTIKDESGQYSNLFWYDKLGRIVVSQNTRQFNSLPKKYSYTLYDGLGRVVQAGEKTENHPSRTRFVEVQGAIVNNFFNPLTINDTTLANWINDTTGARKEVTQSFYDAPVAQLEDSLPANFTQENLRKRISTVMYEEVYDGDTTTYTHASHFSYDIHGNSKTLVQDNKNITTSNYGPAIATEEFKRLDYTYDLISGNVNNVSYQADSADQWTHKYAYDADNRITEVKTSENNVHWDNDASYFYYKHGPLARTELGNTKVQGLDFAYTLQGWIKGVNSNQLTIAQDIGGDGFIVSANPNQYFAKDVCSYSLTYFNGEYQPIDYTSKWSTVTDRFEANKNSSDLLAAGNSLYNGNISWMVTTITDSTNGTALPQGMGYQYDQLNRIMEARAFTNLNTGTNAWGSGFTYANSYFNKFSYDANGNILTQQRHNQAGDPIEFLSYQYNIQGGKTLQNRLYHVNDTVATGSFTDDIEDMGTFDPVNLNTGNNYSYDAEGRLCKDSLEQIDSIIWRVDGKVKEVRRDAGSTKKNLIFEYDAMGNRIAKHIYTSANVWEKSTYYVRDAQGNVLATYDKLDLDTAISYKLKERDIYGSSRLGLNTTEVEMIDAIALDTVNFAHVIGKKQYELSNHLGNVLEVITDRKYPLDLGDYDSNNDSTNESYVSATLDGIVDAYAADIVQSTDYSPFGVVLDKRNFKRKGYAHYMDNDDLYTILADIEADGDLDNDTIIKHALDSLIGTPSSMSYYKDILYNQRMLHDEMTVTASHIAFTDSPQYDVGTGDFTVEAWFKYTNTNYGTLLSNEKTTPNYHGIDFFKCCNKVYLSVASGGAQDQIGSGSTLSSGTWYHVVVVRIGNDPNNWRMFINGVEETSFTAVVDGGGSGDYGANPLTDFKVGSRNGSGYGADYFEGTIKDVRFYNRQFDSTDVGNSYNYGCGASPDTSGLKLWTDMRRNDTLAVLDLSHYANYGSVTNFSSPDTAVFARKLVDAGCVDSTTEVYFKEGDLYPMAFNAMRFDNEVKEGDRNSYDFGARLYDNRLGRWMVVDRSAGNSSGFTTYGYAANSPIIFIDPNGEWVAQITSADGKTYHISYVAEKGDNLATLSTQLGVSVKKIKAGMSSGESAMKIVDGTELKLENLKQVQNINSGINSMNREPRYDVNCANYAMACNGESVSDIVSKSNLEETDETLIKDFESVSESKAKIGTVVRYELDPASKAKVMLSDHPEKHDGTDVTYEGVSKMSEFEKAKFGLIERGYSLSTAVAMLTIKDNQDNIELGKGYVDDLMSQVDDFFKHEIHYAVVALKSKNGKSIEGIIQKHGTDALSNKVESSPDIGQKDYSEKQIQGTKSPYYTKKTE